MGKDSAMHIVGMGMRINAGCVPITVHHHKLVVERSATVKAGWLWSIAPYAPFREHRVSRYGCMYASLRAAALLSFFSYWS